MNENDKPEKYGITPALYSEWRYPRYGIKNPDKTESDVWCWLIRTRFTAYQAIEMMGCQEEGEGASWCFDRMGQSVTELPDGRKVYIGGEYEDSYDPNFHIYNDVVAEGVDGSITIYSYPKDVFPSTDFHSATFIDGKIIIIGSLGYPEDRIVGHAQVCQLDTTSFEIHKVNVAGQPPGWVHGHVASLELEKNRLVIKKGEIYLGKDHPLIENIQDWELDIKEWQWRLLTNRKWTRWYITRSDCHWNHLWEIRQALFSLEANWTKSYDKELAELKAELGYSINVSAIKKLYFPDVPHLTLPKIEDEYKTFRISINDIVVRFVEDMDVVQITVEGVLPDDVIERIKKDTLDKLSALENSPCKLVVY